MPRVIHPEPNFAAAFKRINDRLDKLERASGNFVMVSAGFAAGAGATYSTANSGAYADISGSGFTLNIAQPTRIIYMVFATTHMTAGTGHGYVRGNIVGFDTTASLWSQNSGATVVTQNGMVWYFTGAGGHFDTIPVGTYTVKMQASTDSTASTVAVDQFFHQIFLLGS